MSYSHNLVNDRKYNVCCLRFVQTRELAPERLFNCIVFDYRS
jgi:hypothetical protein